ncbi:MAG TPA: penicillin-binding protein 2 [Burkholderiales bacterium]|nr:penicillin-binding protein 2 [Burkholderiales bacterium]
MNYANNASLRLKLEAWRARLMILVLMMSFVVLIGRAAYLQGLNDDFLQQKGEARYGRVIELPATRGMVMDRHGEPLAISTPVESIWASPEDVEMTPRQLDSLAKLLNLKASEIRNKLKNESRNFVFLKRQIPPELASRVMSLNIPGVFQQREYRRYYPAGEVMAHMVGFTSVDGVGQEGMELAHQNWLTGKPGSRRVIKDRLGHIIEDAGSIRLPQQGKDLSLSIDAKLQYLAYRELKAAVDANKAKGGALVAIDAVTGEVLALVNQPDFNPNNRGKVTGEKTRNRSLTDTFEPGSTLKPLTAALALESGKYRPDTLIDTSEGRFSIYSATIRDTHPDGDLTVAQVIQKSSNVGSAKIALTIEPEKMWNLFNAVGFGSHPKTGFPGEATGKLRPYKSWRPIEQATMSYGHGISVSLLQLARSYTIFTGDGGLRDLTFVKTNVPAPTTPVISSQTAQSVREMLELVTQPGGTAPRAAVPGYRVAGKTGTAHKQEGRGYAAKRYVSSFVGMAPASNPRLIIAVMIDEPGGNQYYGGLVAAPVFSSVMGAALRMQGAPMDAPLLEAAQPLTSIPLVKEEG